MYRKLGAILFGALLLVAVGVLIAYLLISNWESEIIITNEPTIINSEPTP